MAVDVVMGSHNHIGSTARALDALYTNTTPPFNLTIIDDSTDITTAYLNQFAMEHTNVTIIRPEEVITCGNQIINIGFKNTSSPVIVFMTNSVEVEPEWIEVPLHMMEEMKDVAIIGNKNLYPSGTIENAGIYFHSPMMHHENWGFGDPGHRWTHLREVDAVGFCIVFLRREYVYPLEENYYHGFCGFDDVDACFQARKKGHKVYYCGYSAAYHYAYVTRGIPESWDRETNKKYEENRFRFGERWANQTTGGELHAPCS